MHFYRRLGFPGCVLIAISWFNPPELKAEDRTLGPNGPPLSYRIDNASIRLTRQPARGSSIRSVNLSGNGSATVERDGTPVQLAYPAADFLDLLNEFYRIRFFDLPAKYTTRHSIFLQDNGTVTTSALRMADAESMHICITMDAYEKCVTFGRDGPSELVRVAKRMLSRFDR